MLTKYIENFISLNNIKNYRISAGFSILADWNSNKEIKLGNGYTFVYDFRAIGIINNIADLSKEFFKFMPIESISSYLDYKYIISLQDISGAIEASSNHISIHQNRILINYDLANNIFSTIYNAHFKFYTITPIL